MIKKGQVLYQRIIINEGKSVIAERFTRTLNNKIYKYTTSISKNVYIDN